MVGIGLHFGVIVPLVTLILEGWGVGPAVIGLNAAVQPLSLMRMSSLSMVCIWKSFWKN